MSGPAAIDVKAEMLRGAQSLAASPPPSTTRGITSDLSIDEALLLHAAGWEPVDLVCGVSVASVPYGVWTWGQGEITVASAAHNAAVQAPGERAKVGRGGPAVRPVEAGAAPAMPFVSDLSARDFTLLQGAGWMPAGLAFGAS